MIDIKSFNRRDIYKVDNTKMHSYIRKKQVNILSSYPLNILKKRDRNSHKGICGKVAIIGGSYSMSGAVILAGDAALRTGSGLVNLVIPKCILERVASCVYEATYTPLKHTCGTINLNKKDINLILERYDAIAIGVGMGFERRLLDSIKDILLESTKPLVVDADGLNILSLDVEILKESRKCPMILTPHPLEMSRLTGFNTSYINAHREEVSMSFAREYKCILLLKGHETIVTDGKNMFKNSTGNPGMATGGSGDVLTGMILSLLGQGYGPYDSAILGCYLHGLAGDLAYKDFGYGLKASDIPNYIGQYIK